MTFEEILPELKAGKKIIREGWGGFELYVTFVEGEVYDNASHPLLFDQNSG